MSSQVKRDGYCYLLDANKEKFAGGVRYHSDMQHYFLSTRVKMSKSGSVYSIFITDVGRVIANRKYIDVKKPSSVDSGSRSEKSFSTVKVKIKKENNENYLKLLASSPMMLSSFIERIDISSSKGKIASFNLSPYLSKNPYMALKFVDEGHTFNLKVIGNDGKVDQFE
jgi:hypothetical protein